MVSLLVVAVIAGAFHLFGVRQGPRMAPFADAPPEVRDDLLYLSYVDSLARDGRAMPAARGEGDGNIARMLVSQAGVSTERAAAWGLYPEPQSEQANLNAIYRQMHGLGRIILPEEDAALWTHLHRRKVRIGYLVFGQTPRAGPRQVDFCGVVTVANPLAPDLSALLYRDPRTGDLVHGSVGDMPKISYLGGGRLGDDLKAVYREYFQRADNRGRRPLY